MSTFNTNRKKLDLQIFLWQAIKECKKKYLLLKRNVKRGFRYMDQIENNKFKKLKIMLKNKTVKK